MQTIGLKPRYFDIFRLAAISALLFGLVAGLQPAHAQSPGGVATNLQLWLKADAGVIATGPNVNDWIDQTGINNFTRSGGFPTLINNAVNFNPAIGFDLNVDSILMATPLSGRPRRSSLPTRSRIASQSAT